MDRRGGPPQRPASALHSTKINLADLDDLRAPRPTSAPPDSPTPIHALTRAAEEEIQLAEPKRKPPWEVDTDRLKLRHVIGKGAFGCVYKGYYGQQEVAVKLLDWGDGATMSKNEIDNVRASYKQEATMWHNLDHPNITKFVGAHIGETRIRAERQGKDPYGEVFVMSLVGCVVVEYVPNGTLRQYIIHHRDQKISYELAIRFATELAKGLSYLHTRNIVHRDVKTDNILLDQYMHLKIIDFGVARIEAKNPKDMTIQTGTSGYMAPEVIAGKPYDHSCDIYSYGIVLWEIYCCDRPFKNMNFHKYSMEVVKKNVRPPIPKCCPEDLAAIMRRCWDPDPTRRPDMADVVLMLQKIDTGKGGGMKPHASKKFLCFA